MSVHIRNKKYKLAEEIVSKIHDLEGQKSARLNVMRQAIKYFEPTDEVLSGAETIGAELKSGSAGLTAPITKEGRVLIDELRDTDRILLDLTCHKVVNDYNVNVLGLSYMQDQSFFRIEHNDIEKDTEAHRKLFLRASQLYKKIKQSNYFSWISRYEQDITGHGHGCLVIEKDKMNFAKCYAVSPFKVFFEENLYGQVVGVYWEDVVDYTKLISVAMADESLKLDISKINEERQKASSDTTFKVYKHFTALEDDIILEEDKSEAYIQASLDGKKYIIREVLMTGEFNTDANNVTSSHVIGESFYASKPVHPARDRIIRGSPYGLGQYYNLLPKARILNGLTYAELSTAHQIHNPPKTCTAELYEKIKDKPVQAGATFVRGDGYSSGEKPFEILPVAGKLSDLVALKERHQIEVADTLPTSGNIYKVARQSIQEIQQRLSEEEKRLTPLRVNYAKEAIAEHLRRFYAIASEQGVFRGEKYRVQDENGRNIDVSADNPELVFNGFLAIKIKQGEARRVLQYLNALVTLGNIGPESIAVIDPLSTAKRLADNFGVNHIIRSDKQIAEILNAQAENARKQKEEEENKDRAQNVKNVSGSLADALSAFTRTDTGLGSGGER